MLYVHVEWEDSWLPLPDVIKFKAGKELIKNFHKVCKYKPFLYRKIPIIPKISPLSRDSIVLPIVLGKKRPLKLYKPRALLSEFYGIYTVEYLH